MNKRKYISPDILIYDSTAMQELCIGVHGTVETEEQWARENNGGLWEEEEVKTEDSFSDEISHAPMNLWDDSE